MKKLVFILLILGLGTQGCKSKKSVSEVVKTEEVAQVKEVVPEVNSDSIVGIYLIDRIAKIDSGNHEIGGKFIFSTTVLPKAYKQNEFAPLWNSEKNRAEAVEVLLSSKEHGLLPEDYHIKEILNYNSRYNTLSHEELADYDILLTDAVLLYAFHLIKGKVDPETLSSTWNYMSRELPDQKKNLLMEAVKNETLAESLYQLEPQDAEYRLMQKQLSEQEVMVENGGWEKVTVLKTLHPGESDPNLPILRNRLIVEGYLQPVDTSSSTKYDEQLVQAMKTFQKQHGLNSDGIIGSATMKMVNITAEDKRKMLVTNLERRRWLSYPQKAPFIKVNIASFRMQYFENGVATYSSNVVVGKTQKQTPTFADKLELVVFNPTWMLPFSITSTETLSKLKADSNYLRNNNMVLIDYNGNEVSQDGIDWHKYEEGHFPYMVRQEPGPGNALGQVKFLFPNKYAIYLHDTPSKHLFSRDERAFSHGCIRMQNPLQFAQFLLHKQDTSWTMDKINEIIETRETETIRLRKKVPIYLLYQTAGFTDDGLPYYYRDIYQRDEKVYQKLISPETRKELIDSLGEG